MKILTNRDIKRIADQHDWLLTRCVKIVNDSRENFLYVNEYGNRLEFSKEKNRMTLCGNLFSPYDFLPFEINGGKNGVTAWSERHRSEKKVREAKRKAEEKRQEKAMIRRNNKRDRETYELLKARFEK
jgi:N-acetylglucosamine kinase-like BadF-type ATPase